MWVIEDPKLDSDDLRVVLTAIRLIHANGEFQKTAAEGNEYCLYDNLG